MSGVIYRAADRRFSAWKNGGGETAEILCHPAGASFDDFQWRISTARVVTSGPFSVFPGVDRVLAVIEGGAMTLRLPGGETVLRAGSDPFSFPGDLPCGAELDGEPLLDLNVMVRRPLAARVSRVKDDRLTVRHPCVARYLFAVETASGLARHDLQEWSGDVIPPYPAALVIEILSR
ncbi:MAG: HutD family protein [Paracoccus sp. (in: a-proteobacteria)]|nr:HutD family protein [Paracoccus sp. (in: a-proteobacteria)]